MQAYKTDDVFQDRFLADTFSEGVEEDDVVITDRACQNLSEISNQRVTLVFISQDGLDETD